ncbi:hypothetical protein [Metamycoplasma hominis]|nr:hypothetical protein [Metamycoplasma hominis]
MMSAKLTDNDNNIQQAKLQLFKRIQKLIKQLLQTILLQCNQLRLH